VAEGAGAAGATLAVVRVDGSAAELEGSESQATKARSNRNKIAVLIFRYAAKRLAHQSSEPCR